MSRSPNIIVLLMMVVCMSLTTTALAQNIEFKALGGPAKQDDGSFPPVSKLYIYPNSTIIASTSIGLYSSELDGAIWDQLTSVGTNFDVSPTGTLFIANENGCFKSTDKGRNWISLNDELPSSPFYTIAAVNDSALVATTRYLVYHSKDGGKTWDNVTSQIVTEAFTATFRVNKTLAGTALMHTGGPEGYRSIDGGATWTKTGHQPPTLTPISEKIVLAYYGDFWRSTNDGRTWTTKSLAFKDYDFVDFTTDISGAIFSASSYFGGGNGHMIRSTDSGVTWKSIGFTPAATAVAFSPTNRIFLGTRTIGALRSLKALSDVRRTALGSLSYAVKAQNGELTIASQDEESQSLEVHLFNMLGVEEARTVSSLDRFTPITIPISHLATGLYFCQLKAGNETTLLKIILDR